LIELATKDNFKIVTTSNKPYDIRDDLEIKPENFLKLELNGLNS